MEVSAVGSALTSQVLQASQLAALQAIQQSSQAEMEIIEALTGAATTPTRAASQPGVGQLVDILA